MRLTKTIAIVLFSADALSLSASADQSTISYSLTAGGCSATDRCSGPSSNNSLQSGFWVTRRLSFLRQTADSVDVDGWPSG